MRLSGVVFENYRALVQPVEVELRPLTLLFGYNSAGKSSILRSLPLLAASADPGQSVPLALDSEAARGASFKDILSRQSASPTLKLGLVWKPDTSSELRVIYTIRDLADRQLQIVEQLDLQWLGITRETLSAVWDAQAVDVPSTARSYEFRMGETLFGTFPLRAAGLTFEAPSGLPFSTNANVAATAVRDFHSRVHWLNSLRAVPRRNSRFGVRPRRMLADGSNAGAYLAHSSVGNGEILNDSSRWFEKITGRGLDVLRFAAGGEEQYSIVVTPQAPAARLEVPIIDTGEGMAQVLPVIVLGSLARIGHLNDDPILAIEHPELHLHPAAHAELAAFFCGIVTSPSRPTVLVETHSENFLLRVQIAIAAGEIAADDVVIHWIRALENGQSVVDTITFDTAARPQGAGWPPGVFREDTDQARRLLEIRKQRSFA